MITWMTIIIPVFAANVPGDLQLLFLHHHHYLLLLLDVMKRDGKDFRTLV